MIVLPKDATDEDIINVVRDFVNLLAKERYVEAFEMMYRNSKDEMSPELIKRLIEGYGFDESVKDVFRVTSLEEMKNQEPEFQIDWLESVKGEKPREIGIIHYDLPINGEWSDLTAIFDVYELENGIALSLYDIHIL